METNHVQLATTDEEINRCYPVMCELRPHIIDSEFLETIKRLIRAGYSLAYIAKQNTVVAIAGFHISENLAWGKYLYVEDLATLSNYRSEGYGATLLTWLKGKAGLEGCNQLHLDSGIQRKDAHRFYSREGMNLASYHYVISVTNDSV